MSKGLVGGIATGIIIVGIIVGGVICTKKVPAGYVGIVYNMNGGIDGEVLTQVGIWWHRRKKSPRILSELNNHISHLKIKVTRPKMRVFQRRHQTESL